MFDMDQTTATQGKDNMTRGDDTSAGSHRATLWALIKAVEELREIDPKMELGQLLVLLLALSKPGIKMTELQERTQLSRSAVSRNVLALSKETYRKEGDRPLAGRDLLTQVSDPFDTRAKLVAPTARGRRLAEQLVHTLHGDTHGKTKRL